MLRSDKDHGLNSLKLVQAGMVNDLNDPNDGRTFV